MDRDPNLRRDLFLAGIFIALSTMTGALLRIALTLDRIAFTLAGVAP